MEWQKDIEIMAVEIGSSLSTAASSDRTIVRLKSFESRERRPARGVMVTYILDGGHP